MAYTIPDWDQQYENNRSRKVKDLAWVPVPNSHDGEGYMRVMSHPMAAQIFAAWILILEVASKCSRRGVLARENGKPYDAESLAMKTRANAEWFRVALEFLSSEEVGWLTIEPIEDLGAPRRQDDVTPTSPACHPGDEEGNGREKKEWKEGMEPAELASALTDHLLEIPACIRALEVDKNLPKAMEQVSEFVRDHPEYPPDWWIGWAKSLKTDLPFRRAKYYGNQSGTAVCPAKVLEGEWKYRPPDPPGLPSAAA